LPGGASFQARHIDGAVISDAITIANPGIAGQREGGGSCAGVDGDGG
jgi:hypothetical protein